jgi:DNA-directed RNA polymerase subunit RPC12/RpoP
MEIEIFSPEYEGEWECQHCKSNKEVKMIDFEYEQIKLCSKCRYKLLVKLTPEFPVKAIITGG